MTVLGQAAVVAGKDLRIEIRGRHVLASVLPFAATLAVALGLSLGPGRAVLQRTGPSLLWVGILFAAVLASRETYRIEGQDDALENLTLSPLDHGSVFLGKAAAVTVQLLAVEVAVVAAFVVLFDLGLAQAPLLLAAAVLLGSVGLACVGALFGMLSTSPRMRDSVLPLLVLPLVSPVLLAGVRATEIAAGAPGDGLPWLGLLAAFDALFLGLGLLVFGYLAED